MAKIPTYISPVYARKGLIARIARRAYAMLKKLNYRLYNLGYGEIETPPDTPIGTYWGNGVMRIGAIPETFSTLYVPDSEN